MPLPQQRQSRVLPDIAHLHRKHVWETEKHLLRSAIWPKSHSYEADASALYTLSQCDGFHDRVSSLPRGMPSLHPADRKAAPDSRLGTAGVGARGTGAALSPA